MSCSAQDSTTRTMRSGSEYRGEHPQSSCAVRSFVATQQGGFSDSRGCPRQSKPVSTRSSFQTECPHLDRQQRRHGSNQFVTGSLDRIRQALVDQANCLSAVMESVNYERTSMLVGISNGQLAPLHGRIGSRHADRCMQDGGVALDESGPMRLQLGFISCLQRMRFLCQIPQDYGRLADFSCSPARVSTHNSANDASSDLLAACGRY